MLSKSALKMRRWRKDNPERQKEIDRHWRKNNLEKARAKNKSWYRRNHVYKLRQNRIWYQENKDRVNTRVRLYRHGMTKEKYDALLKKQRNRCGVCRKKFRKTPHIDHSHRTGRNRGLLCDDCNLGLGRFKDSVRVLERAIKYLKRNQYEGNRKPF